MIMLVHPPKEVNILIYLIKFPLIRFSHKLTKIIIQDGDAKAIDHALLNH